MVAPQNRGDMLDPAGAEGSALNQRQAEGAGPSSSASQTSPLTAPGLPVRNALTVFVAHFHVRRGNEIVWAKGRHSVEQLSQQGIEWKVLPSGSHLVERDVIYFSVADDDEKKAESTAKGSKARAGQQQHGRLFGVAAFRNMRLGNRERAGILPEEGEDDQRGARMTAVGAIVDCGAMLTPWTQIAATVPHVETLQKLADAFASDPSCHNLLEEWLDMHNRTRPFVRTSSRSIAESGPRPIFAQDPLYMLPAVSNSLGPLFPSILKQLLLASQRLLIYIPPGTSTVQAAAIAFNIGELAHAGCQKPSSASAPEGNGSKCPTKDEDTHGLTIRGIVGLHDVTGLQDEEKRRQTSQDGKTEDAAAWIAWTSDRILLEKAGLFDTLIDLTPMTDAQRAAKAGSNDEEFETPPALPKLMRSHRTEVNGRLRATLQKQTWTTREFAVFRGLEEQASVRASSARHVRRALGRRISQNTLRRSQTDSVLSANNARAQAPLARSASPAAHTSTLLAYLRFWLSSLWIIPRRWRVNLRSSYGYVPLSIRSDGGIRASIMLLPEDGSDTSDSEGEDDSVFGGASTGASRTHLSAFNSPYTSRRLSLEDAFDEEHAGRSAMEDDPILAAAGASSAAGRRRRKSRSMVSQTNTTQQYVSDAASLQNADPTVLPVTPMTGSTHSPARSRNGDSVFDDAASIAALRRQQDDMRDARESVSLALCLFASWSEWISEMVLAIQDLITDKVAEAGASADSVKQLSQSRSARRRRCAVAASASTDDSESDPLVSDTGIPKPAQLELSARDMSDAGLSSTNGVDIGLVQFIASSVTDVPVIVRRSWPILAFFGW